MELTPEERQKIYEEEKARFEAQKQLQAEDKKKKNSGCMGCLTVLGILFFIGLLGAAFSPNSSTSTSSSTTAASNSSAPAKPDLELIETHSTSDGYWGYAAGTVKNNSGRNYGYVQVEVNLYDKSGAQVGSTLANTNNLAPGGIWKFKAIVTDKSVARYEVKDVSGF